jgi:uncharacterized protein YndB with AHSA1/START domain/DNA-binding transcriptional ArsR family regulator
VSLDEGFGALAHPLRRKMLAALRREPRTITELAAGSAMTFAAVSKHLRVLEGAGLVRRQVRGREHYFAVRPGGLRPVSDWVAAHSRLWQQSLESLKQTVETEMARNLRATAEIFVAAPPSRVFDAWREARTAATFLCVGDPALGEARIDARVGGEIYVAMSDGTTRILHRGEFLVVDPPSRLVFTWISQPTDLRLTVVSVDFVAERGGTRVSLVHEGFADPQAATSHAGGWSTILANLVATLDRSP